MVKSLNNLCKAIEEGNVVFNNNGQLISELNSFQIAEPAARETIEVPFFDGEKHRRRTVYKDDLMRDFKRSYLGEFVEK